MRWFRIRFWIRISASERLGIDHEFNLLQVLDSDSVSPNEVQYQYFATRLCTKFSLKINKCMSPRLGLFDTQNWNLIKKSLKTRTWRDINKYVSLSIYCEETRPGMRPRWERESVPSVLHWFRQKLWVLDNNIAWWWMKGEEWIAEWGYWFYIAEGTMGGAQQASRARILKFKFSILFGLAMAKSYH